MKAEKAIFLSLSLLFFYSKVFSQENILPKLDNPMSVEYLKKNLRKSLPRLVYNSTTEKNLKKKMKGQVFPGF